MARPLNSFEFMEQNGRNMFICASVIDPVCLPVNDADINPESDGEEWEKGVEACDDFEPLDTLLDDEDDDY